MSIVLGGIFALCVFFFSVPIVARGWVSACALDYMCSLNGFPVPMTFVGKLSLSTPGRLPSAENGKPATLEGTHPMFAI